MGRMRQMDRGPTYGSKRLLVHDILCGDNHRPMDEVGHVGDVPNVDEDPVRKEGFVGGHRKSNHEGTDCCPEYSEQNESIPGIQPHNGLCEHLIPIEEDNDTDEHLQWLTESVYQGRLLLLFL